MKKKTSQASNWKRWCNSLTRPPRNDDLNICIARVGSWFESFTDCNLELHQPLKAYTMNWTWTWKLNTLTVMYCTSFVLVLPCAISHSQKKVDFYSIFRFFSLLLRFLSSSEPFSNEKKLLHGIKVNLALCRQLKITNCLFVLWQSHLFFKSYVGHVRYSLCKHSNAETVFFCAFWLCISI